MCFFITLRQYEERVRPSCAASMSKSLASSKEQRKSTGVVAGFLAAFFLRLFRVNVGMVECNLLYTLVIKRMHYAIKCNRMTMLHNQMTTVNIFLLAIDYV